MKKEDLRIFGLIWSVIFAFLFYKEIWVRDFFAGFALLFLLVSLLYPRLFEILHIYQNWVRFGNLLGKINGFLISAILFYVIFTPAALILKLLKKDPLRKKLNPAASSYFIDRASQPGEMKNQF